MVSVRKDSQPADFSGVQLVLFSCLDGFHGTNQICKVSMSLINFLAKYGCITMDLSVICIIFLGSTGSLGPLEPMIQFLWISLPTDFLFPQTSTGREDFLYFLKENSK